MRPPRLCAALAVLVLAFTAACGDRGGDDPAAATGAGSPFGRQAAEKGNGPFTATHILIGARNPKMPEVVRSMTQARAAALEVMKKLGEGAKIDALVANYTDDKGSVGRPGTPDGRYEFGPGLMVPAFEKAVRETPPGKIYPDPVETEFGYHIIRRDK